MPDQRTLDPGTIGHARDDDRKGAPARESMGGEDLGTAEADALKTAQLLMLARMRTVAMEIAERVGRKAAGLLLEREEPAFKQCDPVLSFSRISRSMLQIMAMEQEIMGLRETHRREIRAERKTEEQFAIRRAVGDAVRSQRLDLDREDVKALLDDIFDDYDDFDRGSPRETVARICEQLGIDDPDLSIWPEDEAGAEESGPAAAAETADPDFPECEAQARPGSRPPAHANGHDPP